MAAEDNLMSAKKEMKKLLTKVKNSAVFASWGHSHH